MPPIELLSLQFLHSDPFAPFAPLRKNRGTEAVPVPEWQASTASDNPQDSPVAYIRNAAHVNPVNLLATFRRTGPAATEFQVRTDPASTSRLCVAGQVVDLTNETNTITLELSVDDCDGVSVSDVHLQWQFLHSENSWIGFAESRHRLYVILASPGPPWTVQAAPPLHRLWTDVLEVACTQARGRITSSQAATAITDWFHRLGQSADNPGGLGLGWNTQFVSNAPLAFDCARALEFLAKGIDNPCISCADAAAIVSTFANALGARLFQARLIGGASNPVYLIGHDRPLAKRFAFHEVAWAGDAGPEDRIWDGSVLFPTTGKPLPVHGLPFDGVPGSYRDRLFPLGVPTSAIGAVTPDNRPIGALTRSTLSYGELLRILARVHPELGPIPTLPARSTMFGLETFVGLISKLGTIDGVQYLGDTAKFTLQSDGQSVKASVSALPTPVEARSLLVSELLNIEAHLEYQTGSGLAVLVEGGFALQAGNVFFTAHARGDCYQDVAFLLNRFTQVLLTS